MNIFLSHERSKWLLMLSFLAIAFNYLDKVSSHSYEQIYQPQEITHNYEQHHCKASEEIGCRG
tara:strand:+ start:4891 stop:5079 length:189 start_codon:yes stop_codon:yes gene_type:complete